MMNTIESNKSQEERIKNETAGLKRLWGMSKLAFLTNFHDDIPIRKGVFPLYKHPNGYYGSFSGVATKDFWCDYAATEKLPDNVVYNSSGISEELGILLSDLDSAVSTLYNASLSKHPDFKISSYLNLVRKEDFTIKNYDIQKYHMFITMLSFAETFFGITSIPANWSESFGDKAKKSFTRGEIMCLLIVSPKTLSETHGNEYYNLFQKFLQANLDIIQAFFQTIAFDEEKTFEDIKGTICKMSSKFYEDFRSESYILYRSQEKSVFKNNNKPVISDNNTNTKTSIKNKPKEIDNEFKVVISVLNSFREGMINVIATGNKLNNHYMFNKQGNIITNKSKLAISLDVKSFQKQPTK